MKLTEIILDNFAPQNLRALWLQPKPNKTVAFKVFNNGMWMNTFEWQDLSGYLTKDEAAKTYQPVGDYALKSEIPSLSGYATQQWVTSQGYLTTVPAEYVTGSELTQTLTGYVSTTSLTSTLADYLSKTDATATYQPKGEYQPAGDYALKSELPSYTTVPELTADYTVPANATTREFIYEIPVGDTVYNITGASGIKWAGGTAPAVQANKTYLIRVIHNLATWTEF